MQKNKGKQEKKQKTGFLPYLISIVISVIAVIYLGYHFIGSFGEELTTEYSLLTTENDVMEFDAYILRNEIVVYSTAEGTPGYSFSDGTKVKKGSPVASIYGGTAPEKDSVRNQIIELDKHIELLHASNDTDGLAVSDTSTLDGRINGYYNTIRYGAEQGDYRNLPKRRDEFLTLLNKRQIITGEVDSYDAVIESLTNTKEILTTTLDDVTEEVSASATGFFYRALDGYESVFTANGVSEMTLDRFDKMISCDPAEYPPSAIGKIATDFNWHIIMETTAEELRYYTEGNSYQVIFPYNNDEMLTMKLTDIISSGGTSRVLLVLSTNQTPEDFTFKRMQPVEVVRNAYTGYKVPMSAVRLVDGKQGVYILVGNLVDFKYIDILLECDGYYIVTPQDPENDPEYYTKLGLYDVIVTAGKNLYKGKMIS